ncbi:hypothetical protein GCM10027612_38160 [Microbispora bryophytorum subsp. camponoti]
MAAQRGARVLGADVQYHRARLVWGTTREAKVITADGTRPAWRPGAFDRVMLDAPCTGLGALRRRPEARWRRDPGASPSSPRCSGNCSTRRWRPSGQAGSWRT